MSVHQVCVCSRTPCPNNLQLLPNQNLPHITAHFADRPVKVLIDTGAQIPLIDEDFCHAYSQTTSPPVIQYTSKTVPAIGCDGSTLQINGSIVGKFQFHQFEDHPFFVEFYILKKCSQQCIFPYPWLKALKVIIDLNSLSLQYEHPSIAGCLLQAEGDLVQAKLHEQPFWLGTDNKILPHHDEDDDNQNIDDDHHEDPNEDKDPLFIEDNDDDDNDNDNDNDDRDDHDIGPNPIVDDVNVENDHPDDQQSDDCGDNHNHNNHDHDDHDDHDDGDDDGDDNHPTASSTNNSQIPLVPPHLTIPPKSSCTRLLSQMDLACLQTTSPGFYQHDQNLSISVWKTFKGKTMLHLFNDGDQVVNIQLSQLQFVKPPYAVRTLPVKLEKWTINTLSVRCQDESEAPSAEAVDKATQKLQSTYSNFSKSLDNFSLNCEKIPFTIPANIKAHPFDQSTSPLTILHVYLLLLVGSNFKYMLKSQQELREIVTVSGLATHQRTLRTIDNLFKKAKVHKLYSQASLYIVGLVHVLFLDHQRRLTALENKESRQNNCLKETRRLQHKLLINVKATAALYFFNQKLINTFFQNTLQHPYFQQMRLPLSFNQTLSNLGMASDQTQQGVVNHDDDRDDQNHDDDHEDQNVDDDHDDQVSQIDDQDNDHDDAHDDHDHVGDDNHRDAPSVNALTLHPPSPLPTKSSFSQLISEPSPPYQPQSLSFRQYADRLQETCESVSQSQKNETEKSIFSGKKPNLSKMSPEEIKAFVEYSKSPRRLVDFFQDQIPDSDQRENLSSVPELLQSIPLPKWVVYLNEKQILDDYIPNCLRQDFNIFFTHFKDPVFMKFASIFPLPYPPTRPLLQADPPDSLHSVTGLVNPKVLASAVSPFLTPDHPLIKDPAFYLELVQLACILYSFGNFQVSLHALDTGSFRQEFQVQTLLAPNAPVSSFPSRAATENIDEDLDERLDFLIQQGKCQVILGSPFLNQISSVPKKYKTGQIIHSTKSDPILKYIDSLSDKCKTQLSTKSQEISENQRFLMSLLDDPTTPLTKEKAKPSQEVCSSSSVLFGPLLDPALAKLAVYNPSPKMSEIQNLQFESSIPPTPSEIASFSRYLTPVPSKTSKIRRPQKVKFGPSCIVYLYNTEHDVRDRLSFVNSKRFRNNYFLSSRDGLIYQKRYQVASVGPYSKQLVGSISVPSRKQHDVQFLMISSPNVAQLAKNKLNLDWAKNQQFLANANTIHFCIEQISSGALFNMITDDDQYYESVRKLASDPCYLQQTHVTSRTNQNNSDLVKYCFNVTLNESQQAQSFKQARLFGNIQIPKQGSQLFSCFIDFIITTMRRLDHKQPLKAAHHRKKSVFDVMKALDPNLDLESPSFDYKEVTLKQMSDKHGGWPSLLDKIADHYKIVAVWLFVHVNHSSRYKHDISISEVVFSKLELFTSTQSDFILVPINPTTSEFYKIRADSKFTREVLQKSLQNKWAKSLPMTQLLMNFQNQKVLEQNTENQEPIKPRFSKVYYRHINKSFYHKNSIHRIIQASKDSNKLARPILSRAVQSQSDVLKNLGASELFSNYDLTSGYDSLPSDPISCLTNVASYRNREYAFLCASQGGSNSVLFMQRAVCSLMHRIKDEMVLRDCFSPSSIADIEPTLQCNFTRDKTDSSIPTISVSESWLCRPHLDRPGPRLLKSAQKALLTGSRQPTKYHALPLQAAKRRELLNQDKEDRFISSSALVDDLVMSSKAINSEEYRALSETEKLRIHFRIHIFILLSIFSSIDALSVDPGDKPPFKSPLKLRLEKSVFASTSIRYLNIVYLRGYKAIDLQNFKQSAVHISELPETGDQLRSAIGFFSFLINFVPNLRFYLKGLTSLAEAHPAKKSISWENHPALKASYLSLCQVVQNNNALHTLPDDLSQIYRFVLNADACNASLSYLVGFILSSDIQAQQAAQNIRPYKFYSAKLPTYSENLNILVKETFAALFAILDNLAQIKLLPPSVQRCLIIDSKPLYNILSKFQKNGYLDTFYVCHPSVPAYLNRLHQLVTEFEIQIFLMPTKNSPPADFITRPLEKTSCSTNVTNKRVPCNLCPGCQACCIRKNPHSKCPFSISGSPSNEPKLMPINKVEEKSVIVDGKTLHFRDNQIKVDWSQMDQISFKSFLADSCYKPYLQNLSEEELSQFNSIDLNFETMLDHSATNLRHLKLAQDSVSQLFTHDNDHQIHHDDDHDDDDKVDDEHQHRDDDDDNNDGANDQRQCCSNTVSNNKDDDGNPDVSKNGDDNGDDEPVKPTSPPDHRLFCTQSDSHRCFQPNFSVITSKKPLFFRSPIKSSVIIFVTQKKRWHLFISQFLTALNDTAAPNLNYNPNQIQELVLDKVRYLILCVAPDIQEPNSLPMSSFLPNLRRCVQLTNSHNIYYDGNSMISTYQCLPQNVTFAIQLLARFHPAHHCLVFSSHDKVSKALSEHRQLSLQLPLIYNGVRQHLLTVQLNEANQYSVLCKNVKNQIAQNISHLLPPLAPSQIRKCAIIDLVGQITDLSSYSLPLDLTSIYSVLVKDSLIIKCFDATHRETKPTLVANINVIQPSDHSISREIYNKSGRNPSTLMIRLKTPLSHDFYPGLLSLHEGHCEPIFDAHCFPLSQLRQLCAKYPEVDEILLNPPSYTSNNQIHHDDDDDVDDDYADKDDDDDHGEGDDDVRGNTRSINVVNLSGSSEDILCQFLGEFSMLYLSQSNNHLIQLIIKQIPDIYEGQIILKNTAFRLFDGILYGKAENKDSSPDHFKPVLPDDRVLPLLLQLHSQNCMPPSKIIKKVKRTFCHVFGLTSNISLERITSALFPCFKCLTMRPAHMNNSLAMQFKSIGLQAQGKKICSIIAIDVFYLADVNSKIFSNNYISFIICLSCKFIHLKPINRISSYILAQHLLEFVRLTGKTPSVLVSDAATTNIFGEMQLLLKDFQLMHVSANHNILKNVATNGYDNDDNHHDNGGNTKDDDDDHGDNADGDDDDVDGKPAIPLAILSPTTIPPPPHHPPAYLSVPLDSLNAQQKKFLLQDLRLSDPPLFPPILRHCPVSYKANHLTKQTSLGSLDNACKRLQIFLKKTVTYLPNRKEFKRQIEFLVSCFEYQNNFCLEAEATKLIPASLHLGSIRTTNILNLMKNIQDIKQPESQSFQQLQELLNNAKKIREADHNSSQRAANQQARQLKQHGKVKQPGDICQQIKPLDVLFVKSEIPNRPKMSFLVNFHGPCLVLAVQPRSEHLILFGLISGELLTKNFKQIRSAFSKEIYSLPLFPHLGDQVQFRMVTPWSRTSKQSSAQHVLTNGTKIIHNLHKISHFLAPVLPSYKETQEYLRTISLSLGKDHHDDDAHDDGHADDPNNDDHALNDAPPIDPHDSNNDNDNSNNDNDNIKIFVKPSVSFDPTTKQGSVDEKVVPHDNDDGDNDGVDDDHDDDDGADDATALSPSARLHGSPSAPTVPKNPTELTPPIVPISFSRPRKSDPPPNRSLKYNLRQHPVPSKKYQ